MKPDSCWGTVAAAILSFMFEAPLRADTKLYCFIELFLKHIDQHQTESVLKPILNQTLETELNYETPENT